MEQRRINRRSFLKYCSGIAVTLGLSTTMGPIIVRALTSDNRPPVLWLHFAECTGCSEAFLRSTDPGVADILFDVLNVTYHETIQAACGGKAEQNRDQTVENHPGEFICVVEGAIPTADNGVYGMIGGRTMLDIAQSVIPQAKYTIALGSCAAYGGLPAAAPNPTGAKGVKDAIGVDTINITGCPPQPMNLVACITSYLLNDQMPPFEPTVDLIFATATPSIPAARFPMPVCRVTTARARARTTTASSSCTMKSPGASRPSISASDVPSRAFGTPMRPFTIPCGCPCSVPTGPRRFPTSTRPRHPATAATVLAFLKKKNLTRTIRASFSRPCIMNIMCD